MAMEHPLRILLVDDNEENLRLLALLLARSHHRTAQARNGAEALKRLSEDDFDLVLMDIQMPIMDGLTAVRHIRAGLDGVRNPAVPVAALTAYGMSGDEEKFLSAGMDHYLAKPIYKAKLDAILNLYSQA